MKKTNILKTKLKRLIESEVRNVLREEEDIDIETSIAKEFADAVKTELEDELPVEEAVGVVALLSVILISNTVSNMLSKLVSKLSKKYQWEKLENASEGIEKFTHRNEEAFIKSLQVAITPFTLGPLKKYRKTVATALFGFLILALAADAGASAIAGFMKTEIGMSIVKTVKASIKGVETTGIFKKVKSKIK